MSELHPALADTALAESLVAVIKATLYMAGILILALLAYTVIVRLRRQSAERRAVRFRERWQDPLYSRMSGEAVALPPLARAERQSLLLLLAELAALVRGDAADVLGSVARECGLSRYVLRLLASRRPWKRALGIRGAAFLAQKDAVEPLVALAAGERSSVALSAVSALVRLDAERGFIALLGLVWRLDWSTERIGALIRSAQGPATHLVAMMLESAPPARVAQVVRLIELLGEHATLPALRERLAQAGDPEVVAAILHAMRVLGDGADREQAVTHLRHPESLVRMQAAYALGGLGFPGDAGLLKPLLRDPNWWVRYRAAQSLLALVGEGQVEADAGAEADPYAREVLRRVLAERA